MGTCCKLWLPFLYCVCLFFFFSLESQLLKIYYHSVEVIATSEEN